MGTALSQVELQPSQHSLRTTSHLCARGATSLQAKYEELVAQLPRRGFEEGALRQSRTSFRLGGDGSGRPRMYDEEPWSLPRNSVRGLAAADLRTPRYAH